MKKQVIRAKYQQTYPHHPQSTPRQVWWFGVAALMLLLFIAIPKITAIPLTTSAGVTPQAHNRATVNAHKTPTKTTAVKFNDGEATILKEATYQPNFLDLSWGGTDVKIDQVKVLKIRPITSEDENDRVYHGMVTVHFNISPSQDITMSPTQGVLVTSDGQQVNADSYSSDTFDGDIAKDVTKAGNVVFFLTAMDDPKTIKTIQLKWDAHYDGVSFDDTTNFHDYDVTLNLR